MRNRFITLLVAIVATLGVVSPASAKAVHWHKTGATVFNDTQGKWGPVTNGHAFAELGNGNAMGGLKPGQKVRFLFSNHRKVTARKWDYGLGGPDVGGLPRGADIHCNTLKNAHIYDCRTWSAVVQYRLVG